MVFSVVAERMMQVQSMVQQLMDANGLLPTGVATSTTLQVPKNGGVFVGSMLGKLLDSGGKKQ